MSEIIITEWKKHQTLLGFHDNKLVYLDFLDGCDRTGNIYVGRVENIVSNLNAAFVRFEKDSGKHGIGFFPFKGASFECVLNRKISDSKEIRTGDIVLVMVRVEEQKTKQAKLTGNISLMKNKEYTTEELLKIAHTRTEYQMILGKQASVMDCVNDAKWFFNRNYNESLDELKIITDDAALFDEISKEAECTFYDEEKERLSLFIHYSITSKTEDLFKKKVWLESGAYLVVEQTETLNLIDVNSGKNLKKNEEIFLEINKEAALEAYRQIRLRNLSGMILIDFIDLKTKEANEELINFVTELIDGDRYKMKFIDLTGLGIMEFTRDKSKKTLRETIDIKDM